MIKSILKKRKNKENGSLNPVEITQDIYNNKMIIYKSFNLGAGDKNQQELICQQ